MQIEYLADYPDAVAIVARWYFDEWGSREEGLTFEFALERLKKNLRKDQLPISLIGRSPDSRVIGVAQLKIREMARFPDREFWLGSVYVDAAERGNGVARLIVEKVIQIAKDFKITEIWLQTDQLDGGLYKQLGWNIVEQVEHKGRNIAIMCRSI